MTRLVYASSTVPLSWEHWLVGHPAPDTPDTHVQDLANDPQALVAEYGAGLGRLVDTGASVIQYSRRVAYEAQRHQAFCRELAANGLRLRLASADIRSPQPLHLGYVELSHAAAVYPELSAMERGVQAGHCLLVRSGAIVQASPHALPDGTRALANLDVIHRVRQAPTALPLELMASKVPALP